MSNGQLSLAKIGAICSGVCLLAGVSVAIGGCPTPSFYRSLFWLFSWWAKISFSLWGISTLLFFSFWSRTYFLFSLKCFLMTGALFFVGLAAGSDSALLFGLRFIVTWALGIVLCVAVVPTPYRTLSFLYFNISAIILFCVAFVFNGVQ